MSIEEAIARHAEAMEKLAAALTLKAEAEIKSAEAAKALTEHGLKIEADNGSKEMNAEMQSFLQLAREKLEEVSSGKAAAPTAETIAHEDLPTTGAEVSDAAPATVEEEKPAKPVTIESLRSLCVTKSAEKGRDYVLGILAEFGAQRLGDIKPEQYQALYDALTAEG